MRKGEPGNRPPVRTTWARTRWPYRLLRPWLRPYQVDALCQAWLLCPSVAVELLLRRSPQALIAMLQCSAPTGVRFSPEPAAEPPAAKRGRTGARSLPLESSTPPGTDRRSSAGVGRARARVAAPPPATRTRNSLNRLFPGWLRACVCCRRHSTGREVASTATPLVRTRSVPSRSMHQRGPQPPRTPSNPTIR